jgi:hypothetical protein
VAPVNTGTVDGGASRFLGFLSRAAVRIAHNLGIRMAELLTRAEGVAVLIRDGDVGLAAPGGS